jgi:CheY-like chemotaxis protein
MSRVSFAAVSIVTIFFLDGIEAVRRYRAIEQQQALQDPSHDLLLLPSNASFPLSEQQKPLAELPSSSAEAILALRRSSAAEDYTHATAGGGAGDDGTKPLIIVGMSANSDAESKRLAKEAGMNYFLDKPFTIADFNLVLQRIYMKEHHASGDDDGEHFSAPSSPAFTILSEH